MQSPLQLNVPSDQHHHHQIYLRNFLKAWGLKEAIEEGAKVTGGAAAVQSKAVAGGSLAETPEMLLTVAMKAFLAAESACKEEAAALAKAKDKLEEERAFIKSRSNRKIKWGLPN